MPNHYLSFLIIKETLELLALILKKYSGIMYIQHYQLLYTTSTNGSVGGRGLHVSKASILNFMAATCDHFPVPEIHVPSLWCMC